MTPARAVFNTWLACCGIPGAGGDNLVRVDGVTYAIEATPKELKSGALRGRVHEQHAGGFRDLGGFHINAEGRVLLCPVQLQAVLPGAEDASDECETADRRAA